MTDFRVGLFQRDRVLAPLRPFCPIESARTIEAISLTVLHARGKRLILLDVDNTLTHWRSEVISEEVKAWMEGGRALGLNFCLLSNTRHPERLIRLSEALGIPALRGRFKPSRRMYLEAMARFNVTGDACIMIGDQLLTDVLGANRTGIEAIWLEPLGPKEFTGTKINRWVESHLVKGLYRALSLPMDAEAAPPEVEARKPFTERTIVKQLIKFAVVGGSSFVIDAGLSVILVTKVAVGGELLSVRLGKAMLSSVPGLANLPAPFNWFQDAAHAGAAPLFAFASFIAIINSFIWNRRWTFETRGRDQRLSQLRRFLVISVVGYLIQVSISSWAFGLMPDTSSRSAGLAKALGAGIAAFWNFGGQRLYAFRRSDRK